MKYLIISLIILFTLQGCYKIAPDKFGTKNTLIDNPSFPGGDPDFKPKFIILVPGESNAGGFAKNANLSSYEVAPRNSIQILNNVTLRFESLDIGTNNRLLHQGTQCTTCHGIENGIANEADSNLLGDVPAYLVKAGMGGAQVKWFNNPLFTYQGVNGWKQMKTRMDTAIKQVTIINQGIKPKVYILWVQGINDCANNTVGFKDTTKVLFKKFRAEFGEDVPIFMPYLMTEGVSLTANPSLERRIIWNSYITQLKAEVPNFYPLDTKGFKLLNDNHWDDKGFKQLAYIFVRTLKSNYSL